MSYVWFWVHWLAEHSAKSGEYRFTRFDRLTGRDPNEGTKIIQKLLFLTQGPVLRKNKKHYDEKKKSENVLYLILGALVGRARPKIW